MKEASSALVIDAISTSAKLFYFLISIFVIYVSAANSRLEYNSSISNLRGLEIINALVTISDAGNDGSRTLNGIDIPEFFRKAATKAYADGYYLEEIIANGFPDEAIPNARIQPVSMRLEPGAQCEIALFGATSGAEFDLATFQIVGQIYRVSSADTRLVSFGRCGTNYEREFNAIHFRTDKGAVFAIPKSFEPSFPGLVPPKPFKSFVFHGVEEFKGQLPEIVSDFSEFDEPLVVLHVEALRHYVLAYSGSRHGKFYSSDEYELAVSALYEEAEARTSFAGFEATVTNVIRFGPLIFLVVAWELWRHVRRIPVASIKDNMWFPFDVDFRVGAIIAITYSLMPIFIGLTVAYYFIQSQELFLGAFGRRISIDGIISMSFPELPPRGWIYNDYYAVISTIPFFVLMLLMFLISIRLLRLVKINANL